MAAGGPGHPDHLQSGGEAKLERLAKLHESIQVSVVTDNETVAQGYANKFQNPKHRLRVLVECDTGAGRCGVQTPEEALKLARFIADQPGLHFLGLMTYPPRNRVAEVDQWLEDARQLLTENHLAPEVISSGGTPNYYQAAEVKAVTEHRPGTYIYCDRMMASYGFGHVGRLCIDGSGNGVSRPTENRAVVDTGSKSLGSDRCDAPEWVTWSNIQMRSSQPSMKNTARSISQPVPTSLPLERRCGSSQTTSVWSPTSLIKST